MIASGAMAHMMIQVILNIAVVTNTIPNTGITLPFISYGGTSVVFLLAEMGACAECVKSGKIGEKDKKNPYREEGYMAKNRKKKSHRIYAFLCLHLEL